MTTSMRTRAGLLGGAIVSALLAVTGAAGCAAHPSTEMAPARQLSAEVRAVLGRTEPSAEYHRERTRLQEMGPDLDVILIGLIGDTRARTETRADALVLLADRKSPLALPTLESALQSGNERIRSAAVLGLKRIAASTPVAVELIRRATRDRSRTVRLNALQSLSLAEVETIRQLLPNERDREVRQVGMQLIAIAEARGAPLAADARGSLRTFAGEGGPQIVFRPVSTDTLSEVARGDLRIELPDKPDIPLAASATVVSNVVPAFFSPDQSAVAFETDGQIRVVDIATRTVRSFGPGLAPRPIPFTHQFVFLRQREVAEEPDALGREIIYDLFRAPFETGRAELIGEVSGWIRADRHAGESPMRWMIVDEVADGFALKGEGMETYQLPRAVWTSVPGSERISFTQGVPSGR